MAHAEEDKLDRARISLIEEAQSMLRSLGKLLDRNQDIIPSNEVKALRQVSATLQQAISDQSVTQIRSVMDQLEQLAKPVAELVMNRAVADHLRNKNIQ
jgi:molecular chaperone DnaK (HSP70)